MLRLLQISSCISGSTGSIAQQIGKCALQNGWDSWIAYSAREPRQFSESHLIPIGSLYESQLHAIETRLFDRHGLGSRLATKKLINQIEQIQPSLIHLHNIHGYYLNYRILFEYLKTSNIPVVWTLHDCWAFTGHCVHFTDVQCFKWRNDSSEHCSNCPKKVSYPASLLFDRSEKNYAMKRKLFSDLNNLTIIPVSKWLANVTAQSFLGKYPIKVIQNGINTEVFYPRSATSVQCVRDKYALNNKFVILGVAKGWSKDVGLHHFYRLRSLLNENFAIVLVGLTKRQIAELPNGIIGITHTSNANELAELYTAADLFFNGSIQETFGLVTAESMACGTKVLVFNSTACAEFVNEKTGYVLPVGGLDDFVPELYKIATKTNNRGIINEDCVNYVRTHLDKNKKYQEYVNLYNTLVESL